MSEKMRPRVRAAKRLKTAVWVATLAIAAACTSTRTTEADRNQTAPCDHDTGATCCQHGAMSRADDRLMPIDYNTGPYYDRCGAWCRSGDRLIASDCNTKRHFDCCSSGAPSRDKLLPIDYDSGISYARCCEVSQDGVCPCHSEKSVK